jgi:hypothetical protein
MEAAMSVTNLGGLIQESAAIPDILRAAPLLRPVFDRYGLRGCGGPLGPAESLGFFARAHDVPLDRLTAELRAAVERPASPPELQVRASADAIYRPFFRAGIAIVLTLGAAWGAYLLLRIGLSGSFATAGLHEVNAHGHAQIFGWVGLFIMGFAYQAFPRFKNTTLSHPRLAGLTWWMMVAGVLVRAIAEPLAAYWPWTGGVAMAAAVIEVVAIGLFAYVLIATLRGSGKPLVFYDSYILCALSWFVIQAVYECVYLGATLTTTGRELVPLVATWQAPLRDLQIHGFAMLMILGVSQRLFHHVYGLPTPDTFLSRRALLLLNAAIIGESLGLVLMRTGGHAWVLLWYGSVLALTATVVGLVANWHIFGRAPEPDRSLKFLRTAYLWLFVSLGMLVLLPVYLYGVLPRIAPDSAAVSTGFSHAYYGATRHAITVGFVSLMIVGVAAKVVPTLNGVDRRGLSSLWPSFVLINTGCALRVVGQTLTDIVPSAFPVTALSGLLEVTGLAVWGVHLWRIMSREADASADERIVGPVTATHRVSSVLEQRPESLSTFLAFGFRPLSNPILRRTLGRGVTLHQACRLAGVDEGKLLHALNVGPDRRPSLEVVDAQEPKIGGCSCCEERAGEKGTSCSTH